MADKLVGCFRRLQLDIRIHSHLTRMRAKGARGGSDAGGAWSSLIKRKIRDVSRISHGTPLFPFLSRALFRPKRTYLPAVLFLFPTDRLPVFFHETAAPLFYFRANHRERNDDDQCRRDTRPNQRLTRTKIVWSTLYSVPALIPLFFFNWSAVESL